MEELNRLRRELTRERNKTDCDTKTSVSRPVLFLLIVCGAAVVGTLARRKKVTKREEEGDPLFQPF